MHCVPRPLSISNPVRLRFDDFELDEANAGCCAAERPSRSRLPRAACCARWRASRARC